HRAHDPEDAVLRALRRPAVELEVLEPALVGAHAHRAGTEALLEVLLPEPRRLEDVSVGIDRAVVRKAKNLVAHAISCVSLIAAGRGGPSNPASRVFAHLIGDDPLGILSALAASRCIHPSSTEVGKGRPCPPGRAVPAAGSGQPDSAPPAAGHPLR